MAEATHLQILAQGAESWNDWRKEHPEIQPDLNNANLKNRNLSNMSFQNTDLSGAQLQEAHLNYTDFCEADLNQSNLSGAKAENADFRRANLYKAFLQNTLISLSDFTDTDLQKTNLVGAKFDSVNLTRANLQEANLNGASMKDCNFHTANLHQAVLKNVNFMGSSLEYADLTRAILIGTLFIYTQLAETRCDHATMGWTQLHAVDLHQFQGLETVLHNGPSEVSFSTISRSQKSLPETFLQNTGISEAWLSIYTNPQTQFYSAPRCFICYGTPDHSFAEQLQKDLRTAGIRCWLSLLPAIGEDYSWGQSSFVDFLGADTESFTTLFDQIILVLSHRHSDELTDIKGTIRRALEKERQTRIPVLFPLQLDADIYDTDFIKDVLPFNRFIYDLSQWTNEQTYQHAITDLLHDLHY